MTRSNVTWIPTSSVSFEDQVRVLRSYVDLSNNGKKGIQYMQVMNQTHLARTQVSGVNGFFMSLGFLEMTKRGHYTPSEAAVEFVRMHDKANPFEALTDALSKSRLFEEIKSKYVLARVESISHDALVSLVLKLANSTEKFRAESALEWFFRAGLLTRTGSDSVKLGILGREEGDFKGRLLSKKETGLVNEYDLPLGVDLIAFRLREGLFAIERDSLRAFLIQQGKKLSGEIQVNSG